MGPRGAVNGPAGLKVSVAWDEFRLQQRSHISPVVLMQT